MGGRDDPEGREIIAGGDRREPPVYDKTKCAPEGREIENKKAHRIQKLAESLHDGEDSEFPIFYLGYFRCFNAQQYYEAHDVLEHLWLKKRDENYAFFKGLIQLAGA